ncbi:MAG: ABC transporter substrate-binding protein [Lachnospiraceae bacterium]|nr:ABC transporter substrate-binding protein [Lachnospiraceae bacterium]
MKSRYMSMILAAVLAVGMTACKGNPAGDGPGTADRAEADSNSRESEEVTFVLDWTPNTNHTGVYVAQAKGYFEEAGLNVNIIQPPEDGATMLVAGGGAQFGVDFQDSITPAFATESPLPVTAVAAVIQHNTSGLISLKEKGIDAPKKMEGFTYATWELEIEQAIMKYVMEQDGGDYSKLELIPSTVSDVVTALQTDVDLVWIYYAWDGIAAQRKGLETNYINFADLDAALDYYSPIIIANNDYLAENPQQAKAFLQAVRKGYEFAIENPQEAADILCEAAPELDKEIVLESQKWLADQYQADAPKWGIIDKERWDGFYQWLYDHGVIETEIPDGTGFSNEYIQ